jgi:2'-5' RNA ligase
LSESALIVVVREAERLVGDLRLRYDESARLGVPAHITLLFPFVPASELSQPVVARLARLFSTRPGFAFELASVGRFAATSYLAPSPAQPFIELTQAIWQAFPACPPFQGEFASVVPHLTTAHGNAAEAELAAAETASRLARHGPVRSNCRSVALFERSSGRWRHAHEFQLAPVACVSPDR